MRLLILLLILVVPSLAGAQPLAVDSSRSSALRPRLDPPKPACGDSGKAGAIAHLAADQAALGEPNPPWRRMLDAGRGGCDAVAAWLTDGAPGAGDGQVEKATVALVARADGAQLEQLWGSFGARSDAVDAALVTALGARLVALAPGPAHAIAQHPSATVRRAALPLIVGHHSVGRWETVYGRPIWRESSLHVAPEPPSTAHLEAARAILQEGRGKGATAAQFADLAGRLLEEGAPGADRWVPLLLPMVELAGKADQPTANVAARAIAWGAVDAASPLEVLLGDRRREALSYYLDGLAARLRAKDDLEATLSALARVAEAELGAPSERARKMHSTWSRKRA